MKLNCSSNECMHEQNNFQYKLKMMMTIVTITSSFQYIIFSLISYCRRIYLSWFDSETVVAFNIIIKIQTVFYFIPLSWSILCIKYLTNLIYILCQCKIIVPRLLSQTHFISIETMYNFYRLLHSNQSH